MPVRYDRRGRCWCGKDQSPIAPRGSMFQYRPRVRVSPRLWRKRIEAIRCEFSPRRTRLRRHDPPVQMEFMGEMGMEIR